VLPKRIDSWSLTSLQQRLVKTGGRLVRHARYYWLLLAESSSDPTLVRVDAPADLGTARADELTQDPLTEGIWRSNEARACRYFGRALSGGVPTHFEARKSSRGQTSRAEGRRRNDFSLREVLRCIVRLITVGQNGNPGLDQSWFCSIKDTGNIPCNPNEKAN
jgi:hypothetical protein